MRSDFDTEAMESRFKDKDGYEYYYDLFYLAKIIRPGYIDKFYKTRTGYTI